MSKSRHRVLFLIAFALSLTVPSIASAVLLPYKIQGEYVDLSNVVLGTFSGSFILDTDALDPDPDPTDGRFDLLSASVTFSGGPLDMLVLATGGSWYQNTGASDYLNVEIFGVGNELLEARFAETYLPPDPNLVAPYRGSAFQFGRYTKNEDDLLLRNVAIPSRVTEPGAITLLILGLAGFGYQQRRRRAA